MKKVRFGVLSGAKIGVEQVIPAMQKSQHCLIEGIASRDEQQAKRIGKKLNIPKTYGSYESLLADPDIDAVYIPLPNHLHVPWSIKSLEAGKHVLCEKPLALTTKEAARLLDASSRFPHLKIMEAFMYRHHPQWHKAKEIVDGGEIGKLRTVQSFFSYFNDDENNIRNIADIGGGGMMDIGCYCLSLSRYIFGRQPTRVCGMMDIDSRFHTDTLFSGMLDFVEGSATFTCSTQLVPYQRVNILGTKGRVEIKIPFNAPNTEKCVLLHYSESGLIQHELPICDQYGLQGDSLALAIVENKDVLTPLLDGVENMHLLRSCIRSAEKKEWIDL